MTRSDGLTADERRAAKMIYVAGPARSAQWRKAWQGREDRSEGIWDFIERVMADERNALLS